MPNPRFIPYVQLHEFESLLLVDVNKIPEQFPDGDADGAPDALRRSIGNMNSEDVDDGKDTAPSKRIIAAAPKYKRRKAVAGPAIASAIGIEKLRLACPHFNEWLSKLERLAG